MFMVFTSHSVQVQSVRVLYLARARVPGPLTSTSASYLEFHGGDLRMSCNMAYMHRDGARLDACA